MCSLHQHLKFLFTCRDSVVTILWPISKKIFSSVLMHNSALNDYPLKLARVDLAESA